MNQHAIAQRVLSSIQSLWMRIANPQQFSDSWRTLEPVIQGIIDTHYQMSAADASEYYGMSRAVAGFYGGPIPGSPIDQSYLSHMTSIMGVGQFFHFLDKGSDAVTSSAQARDMMCGSAVRIVMNGGRNTVTRAAARDDVAAGWERIVEPGSCSYCSRLAASNGIHKTESDAFQAHDFCECLARVVFRGQESANAGLVSDWQRETAGRSGKAAVKAWDQYWSDINGSKGNSGGEPEAQTAPTGQGAGDAPVEVQPV
jgi:hypothetical protein